MIFNLHKRIAGSAGRSFSQFLKKESQQADVIIEFRERSNPFDVQDLIIQGLNRLELDAEALKGFEDRFNDAFCTTACGTAHGLSTVATMALAITVFAMAKDAEGLGVLPTAESVLCTLKDICDRGKLTLNCNPKSDEPTQAFGFWNLSVSSPMFITPAFHSVMGALNCFHQSISPLVSPSLVSVDRVRTQLRQMESDLSERLILLPGGDFHTAPQTVSDQNRRHLAEVRKTILRVDEIAEKGKSGVLINSNLLRHMGSLTLNMALHYLLYQATTSLISTVEDDMASGNDRHLLGSGLIPCDPDYYPTTLSNESGFVADLTADLLKAMETTDLRPYGYLFFQTGARAIALGSTVLSAAATGYHSATSLFKYAFSICQRKTQITEDQADSVLHHVEALQSHHSDDSSRRLVANVRSTIEIYRHMVSFLDITERLSLGEATGNPAFTTRIEPFRFRAFSDSFGRYSEHACVYSNGAGELEYHEGKPMLDYRRNLNK